MALSIKTAEADRLARELAAVTHESLTEAVTVALRERLERLRRSAPESGLARIQEWVATLPVADPRTPDEIIGYDDRGLPA